ncbi:uncharacterized protein LOC130762309 [Actinidia eriantha]|uniref:uncharacterized protein LOC130762309 n=1 Tax=Actinidia eriantha TaxID=165200 RepID=UPI00258D4535|nr:uncharacterized protein LOC130762309 [Actinidia eriantha]
MTISIESLDLPYHSYQLYDVTFIDDTIETLVTDTPCIMKTWISHIQRLHCCGLNNLIVGLDVEWRPTRNRSNTTNPAANLQLCVGRNCLIFQLIFAPYIPQSPSPFLSDDDYTLWGLGFTKMKLHGAGLVKLARKVLWKEFEKPKRVTLSNCYDDWLSDDQIQYACVDAFISYKIRRRLMAGNW